MQDKKDSWPSASMLLYLQAGNLLYFLEAKMDDDLILGQNTGREGGLPAWRQLKERKGSLNDIAGTSVSL